ncbi:hypothetical protein Q4I30_005791 [Leishmania utingensis]|uniref:Surface antigen-like protein n=1 Tax=Leishmania utingensis TaxID=653362 RepID=A0AAW3A7T7_9TRYP
MAFKFIVALTLLLTITTIASAQTCPPGYTMVGGQCVSNCKTAHCDICDPNDATHTDCLTCTPGYVLNTDKSCMPSCTITNCVTCSFSGNNACQQCAPGYLLTASGTCMPSRDTASTVASVVVASTIVVASVFAFAV